MYVLVCMCSNDRYRMNHRTRGQMIIINNKEFDDLEDREGTDEDGKNLKAAFEKLGFTVKEFMDRTADEMLQLMDDGNNVSSSSWLS